MSGLASIFQIMQARNSPEQIRRGLIDMKDHNPLNMCVLCRQQLIMHTDNGWLRCIEDGSLQKYMPSRNK